VGWGQSKCGPSSREVYQGQVAGAGHTTKGGGYQSLCLTSDPDFSPPHGGKNNGARIYGGEYQNGDKTLGVHNHDPSCVVCELTTTGSVYTQWGRSQSCSNADTLYNGYIMTNKWNHNSKTEYVCVSAELSIYTKVDEKAGQDRNGHLWYPTEMRSGSADEAKYKSGREVGCSVCRHSPAWSDATTKTATTTTGTDTLNQQFDRDLSAVAADSKLHTNRTADDLLRAIEDSKALVDSDVGQLKADLNGAIDALRDEFNGRQQEQQQFIAQQEQFIAFSTDPILVPEASGCGATESCPGKATITGDVDGDLTMRGDTLSFESKECGLTDLCELKQQVTAMFKRFKPDTTTTATTATATTTEPPVVNGTGNGTGTGTGNVTNCELNAFGPGC